MVRDIFKKKIPKLWTLSEQGGRGLEVQGQLSEASFVFFLEIMSEPQNSGDFSFLNLKDYIYGSETLVLGRTISLEVKLSTNGQLLFFLGGEGLLFKQQCLEEAHFLKIVLGTTF